MRIPGIVALCAALAARHRLRILLQHTCRQSPVTARSEAQAVSTRAATLSGVQDSQRTKDQWTTAAAVVVFWPAAFLVQGDKQTAAELAQMKGQMVAIEQASIAKKCNIQFQGKPPDQPSAQ